MERCKHQVCGSCMYTNRIECLQCGLCTNFTSILDDACEVAKPQSNLAPWASFKISVCDSSPQPKEINHESGQALLANTITPNNQNVSRSRKASKKEHLCSPRSEADSVSTNCSKLRRFVCQFHQKDIVSKHLTKNKFYCEDCNVNSEYVSSYDIDLLLEDLDNLEQYVQAEQISLDFDITNLRKLSSIYSKTVMVLNMKVEQARIKYDKFVPFTDGKGPITRMNLRRLKDERKRKTFGSTRLEESKVNKWVNDLCRHYDVSPKAKEVEASKVKLMMMNADDQYERMLASLMSKPEYDHEHCIFQLQIVKETLKNYALSVYNSQ